MEILNEAFKTKAEMFSPRLLGSVFGDMPWVLPDLWEHKHTAIYGRKGTGKSMLLRYLSLPVQLRLVDDRDDENLDVSCWGQYIILAKGSLPQCNDTSVDTQDYERIFGHWFNLRLADAFLDSLEECQTAKRNWFHSDNMLILKSFGEAVGMKKLSEAATFKAGREAVYLLTNEITEFVNSTETSETVSLENYRRKYCYRGEIHTPEMFLTHLCEVLNTEWKGSSTLPVFLLLDQWDSLSPKQREVLYPLFNNRSPQRWFMKVGSVRPYDSDLPPVAWDELAILNVEEDADGPGYAKLCRDALRSRLSLMEQIIQNTGVGNSVLKLLGQQPEDLFPTCPATDQYRDWSERKRVSNSISLFDVSRDDETKAHFALLRAGISPLYCGVDTMIRLSSGFLRVFLELVHRVLKHALSSASTLVNCDHVPHDWQDRAIRMECAELLEQKLKTDTENLCPGNNDLSKEVQTWVKNLNRRFLKTFELGSGEPTLHRIEIRLSDDDPAYKEGEKLASVLVATGVLTPEHSWNGLLQGKQYRISRSYAPNTQLPLIASREPLRLSVAQFMGLKDETRGRLPRAEEPSILQIPTFFATAFREGEWQIAVRNTMKNHIFPEFGLDYHDGEPYHESSQEIGRKVREMIRRMDLLLFEITDENANVCFEFGMGVARNRPCYLIMNTAISVATKRQKESKVFPIQYTSYKWPQEEIADISTGAAFDSLFKAIETINGAYQKKAKKDENPLDERLPKDYAQIPRQIYVHVWTQGRISTWEKDIHNMIRELNLTPAIVPAVSAGMTLKKYTEAAAHSVKCIVDTSGCDRLACAVLGYVFMRDSDVLAVYDKENSGVITNWIAEDAYRSYSSKDELLEIVKCFLQE